MNLFGFFRKIREQNAKSQEKSKKLQEEVFAAEEKKALEEKAIEEAFEHITVFPGNKQEFEELVGYECSVIDTGTNQKGVYLRLGDFMFKYLEHEPAKKLIADGIVAIIHATPNSWFRLGDDQGFYGLPVKKR